jgi:hypothetical protein
MNYMCEILEDEEKTLSKSINYITGEKLLPLDRP